MFGSKTSNSTPLVLSQEKFDTLIGRHTEIQGKLVIQDSVRIDGRVIGNIEASRDVPTTVVIGATGEVQGDILANRVVIAGKVSGHIHAHDRVELHASSLIQGDIKYGSIAIEHGARVLGLLLQVDNNSDQASRMEIDTQEAIRKAQASNTAD